jgi:hypothetical protein
MIISSGLKNVATRRERPIVKPTGTAKQSASAKPISMRRIEARMFHSASGSVRIAGTSRSASCAGGRPEMSNTRAANSHAASRPAAAISGGSPGMAERRIMRFRFSRSPLS